MAGRRAVTCVAGSDRSRMVEESKEREQKENTGSEEEEGEERSGKRVVGPRKKFRWNQEIRCLLIF